MHQLRVIPQLRIDHFNVLRVPLQEQILHVVEATLDVRTQLAHGHALTCTNLAAHFICDYEDGDIKIVSSLPNAVCHLVNLTNLSKELVSKAVVLFIRGCIQDFPSEPLFTLIASHLLHDPDGFRDVPASVSLDRHELGHVGPLIDRPILIKLLEKPLNFGSMAKKLFWAKLAEGLRHGGFGRHHGQMQL